MDIKEMLSHVDHTLLKTTAVWEDIRQICDDAVKYGTASVCIPASSYPVLSSGSFVRFRHSGMFFP